ncbi:MAG: 16S rRNA (guanine(966)-N(2))-methyltransferase RsmD [Candidatus Caldatribacteriota bacterium]|nr:16S rRNA (guanine(966)-N(2))-methyltransferase RsmD [Candidatus Caldatribacteriota bacterium]
MRKEGKIMKIVAGKNKGNKLKYLKDVSVRPTSHKVREALFDVIKPYIDGAVLLDLFAGVGAIGIEALSRGAKKVIFIDNNIKCVKIIKKNLEITRNIKFGLVFKKEYLSGLKLLEKKKYLFDCIFMDPPYNKGLVNVVLSEISKLSILKKDGIVIVQHHKEELIDRNLDKLKLVKQKKYSESLLSFIRMSFFNL